MTNFFPAFYSVLRQREMRTRGDSLACPTLHDILTNLATQQYDILSCWLLYLRKNCAVAATYTIESFPQFLETVNMALVTATGGEKSSSSNGANSLGSILVLALRTGVPINNSKLDIRLT